MFDVEERRAFSTKQVTPDLVVYNQSVELSNEHILILAAGCGVARAPKICSDNDFVASRAHAFFYSIKMTSR